MRYCLKIMARTKKTPPTEQLKVRSPKITPTAEQLLNGLSQDAADALGRPVSSSTMLRALLTYVTQQPPSWVSTTIFPLIDQEIAQGSVWGKKK